MPPTAITEGRGKLRDEDRKAAERTNGEGVYTRKMESGRTKGHLDRSFTRFDAAIVKLFEQGMGNFSGIEIARDRVRGVSVRTESIKIVAGIEENVIARL